jgi:hypothetical protein
LSPEATHVCYPIQEINKLLVHPLHPEIAWAAASNGSYTTLNGVDWKGTVLNVTVVDLAISAGAPDLPHAALYDMQNKAILAQGRCDHTPAFCDWVSNFNYTGQLTIDVIRVDPSNPQRLLWEGYSLRALVNYPGPSPILPAVWKGSKSPNFLKRFKEQRARKNIIRK